jgi:hypothetical protein
MQTQTSTTICSGLKVKTHVKAGHTTASEDDEMTTHHVDRTTKKPMYEVLLLLHDGRCIAYHATDYHDLLKSLADVKPIMGTCIAAVCMVQHGRVLHSSEAREVLRDAGAPPSVGVPFRDDEPIPQAYNGACWRSAE